jgi:hypothetical protein
MALQEVDSHGAYLNQVAALTALTSAPPRERFNGHASTLTPFTDNLADNTP